MKLPDLVKPLEQQTEDELIERLRQIRHNRFVERPAAKKKAAKEAASTTKKPAGLDKLLAGLSEEQRNALIAKLTEKAGDDSGGQTQDDQAGQDRGGE